MPPLWHSRLHSPGIHKMANRDFAVILEEITATEISIGTDGDDGFKAHKLQNLKQEAYEHPDAAAGRDLPPIIGVLGS